jgi:hypothetical protein
MIKSAFNFLKVASIAAGLAMILIPSLPTSTATTQPPTPEVNLAGEERVIAKYTDDLLTYEASAVALSKRATFIGADLDGLQNKSGDLKRRLAEVQNAVRDVVRKLKAADEWNDLDTRLAARITDPKLKAQFEQESFKRELEEAASDLTSQVNEISLPVERLRKRLTGRFGSGADFQMVQASYAPTPLARKGLGCRLAILRFKIGAADGTPSPEQAERVGKRCGEPDGLLNPF